LRDQRKKTLPTSITSRARWRVLSELIVFATLLDVAFCATGKFRAIA
jgi:hypothetical protein